MGPTYGKITRRLVDKFHNVHEIFTKIYWKSSTTCRKYLTSLYGNSPTKVWKSSQFLGNVFQNMIGKISKFVENIPHDYIFPHDSLGKFYNL